MYKLFKCRKITPSERLRVFISSAQCNEGGFAWSEVRRRIKDTLSQCVYLNPFIIEDEASSTPSIQFIERQIERADIVVILVKGEIRRGTKFEYVLSRKHKKPLLVYFLEEDVTDLDVIELKNDLQLFDRCTYHPISDFDDIEKKVFNHVMSNIIRVFQDKYYVSGFEDSININLEMPEDKNLHYTYTGIPSKTEIGKFSSCYNYLFDALNLGWYKKEKAKSDTDKETVEPDMQKIGCAIIQWLITGKWTATNEDIRSFVSSCSYVFVDEKWLLSRWDAIRYCILGDMSKALLAEEKALKAAKESQEPLWIINNILIDCRNLALSVGKEKNEIVFDSEYQNELTDQGSFVFFPLLDRYLTDIYNNIEEEEFRMETATPYTQIMGTKLPNILKDLANYIFTAAIYGSYTHLQISRDILAHIMNRYSKITGDSSFTFVALKQYVLTGDTKKFKSYIESTWDILYSFLATQADNIWQLAEYTPVTSRDSMKQAIFTLLGGYLTDTFFAAAEGYIFDYSNNIYWGNSEQYFEAILANVARMDADRIIQVLTPIIANNRFNFGRTLSHIIMFLDLETVSEHTLKDLASVLNEQLPKIINMNGDPQMIAALVQHNKTIFGNLESVEGNGLIGLQESLYRINLGSENWVPVLKSEIDSARNQFERNREKGVFCGFASDPYKMISHIIRKEAINDGIIQLLENEVIPLSVEVLNSDASVQAKEPCAACLCEILSTFSKNKKEVPDSLKQTIQSVDTQKGTDFFILNTRKALEIRVLMAKTIVGIVDVKSLLQWCVEFNTLEIREKIVFIDCVEKYLYHRRDDSAIDSLLIFFALQCSSEEHPDIRRIAIRCLAYVVSSTYQDIAISALNKAVFDPSNKVRQELLSLCMNGILTGNLSDDICKLLQKDANYNIRKSATLLSS